MAGLRIPWEELGGATSLPVDLARSPRFVRDARRDADSGSSRLDRNSGNVSAMATTGTLIVLPNINRNDGWDTWIQTQNVGDTATGVIVFLWGEYSAECPPNDCGPIEHFCQMIPAGSSWSLHTLLPTSVTVEQGACEGQSVRPSSAVVYSLATDTFTAACDAAEDVEGITIDWRQWEVDYPNAHPGEQLAVTVKRTGPGDANPGVSVASSYTGISEDMLGAPDPSYTYYAPLIYGAADNGFSSEIDIQNAGGECTVVWVYFMTQSCLVEHVAQVEALAPGETYQCDAATYVGPGFEGSARIVAEQPLGIVVDQVGNDMLMSYNGVPAEGAGSKVSHAPLIYREYLGWDTDIAVQNLSSTVDAKVKVHFLDSSGDVISTVEDWICPQGATSFQLPAIDDLPGNYVGTARIESQDYDDGGSPVEGPQVHAVVSLVKYSGASPVEALAYNALPSQWVTGVGVVAFASLTKGGDGWTSEIAIQNANPSPGYTDFAILIYDETRLLDHVCERLNEGQVECVDLSAWDCIMPGFVGSVVISATHSTQAGGFALAAVGVERAGTTLGSDVPGDEVSCSEGFPLLDGFDPGLTPECPPALPTPSPSPPSAIGRRLVLPAIDDQDGWETRIEIQNVGDEATWAAIVYWGDPGPCPPNENGPLVTWDKQWLAQGGHWSPPPRHTARSAIVLSLAAEPTALPDETTPPTGEPLAVTVKRAGPGDTTPAVSVTSSYQGVSEDMLGVPDPSYAYHASGVYSNALNGLSSRIHMQNAGELCTPVWVYFRDENCMIVYAHHVEELAPGETYRLDASSVLAPGFVGSAWIAAELPLGIVVDQVGNDMLTTHNAIPAEGAGSQVNYVPLIYREYQGWETNITVYNLSRLSVPAKVKVYFLDASGAVLTTLVDWVCPGGSADFQLPAINDLPGSHVGAARVESQSYLSFGTPVPVEAPDIHSVVTLSKHSGSTPVQAMSYNALPSQWASGVGAVAFPSLTKAGGGWTSEIAIKNVNLNPGYTDLTIFVHDETGQLVDYVCARLKEKQVGYINLDKWWSIAPGFVGSMVISGTHTTQDGGFALAAVGVERLGATLDSDIPGDELSGSVGIPLLDGFQPGSTVECPTLASVVGVGGACDLSLDAEGHVKAVLPYTYTFGWGDGTESDAATAWDLTVTGTHVYSHCGADVTLLITDATGQTFSTEEFLRVNEPPSISSVPSLSLTRVRILSPTRRV